MKLKKCPFCGNKWEQKDIVLVLWHKHDCIFGGPNGVVHSTTIDDPFVKRWNTRPIENELIEALEFIKLTLFHGGLGTSNMYKRAKAALAKYKGESNG